MSLQFTRCSFQYGRKVPVLSRLSLSIDHRATVLLGPNGAGKSTLLGIASSWITPTQGAVNWRGINPARSKDQRAYRRAVGWLPQNVKPMPGLTVRENVAYIGWLKGMSRNEAWDQSSAALHRVKLSSLADRKSHQMSGGQLRRMGIAGTLVHESEIILLDEPTAGLDPSQRQNFRDLVTELLADVRIVVSTHQTEDLDAMYERVVILDQGKVRFDGDTHSFLSLASPDVPEARRAEGAYTQMIAREV
ncbi:ABC transporter ATP-binding protein [Streptomyces sp. ISL-100]|uniref:ABC transporter ATP-binding protein n=1 Tax=Streptomyces sp. ISL-100 TaxID=2819173 RepID=UPI001BEB2A1D|nr:ATP-binding cassette domain-containing protein [Streptomyces sp. ISL-100]MBT2401640.1 ATP-binding cassette domain-containing protein [Streptomyces sp. ISL-100]